MHVYSYYSGTGRKPVLTRKYDIEKGSTPNDTSTTKFNMAKKSGQRDPEQLLSCRRMHSSPATDRASHAALFGGMKGIKAMAVPMPRAAALHLHHQQQLLLLQHQIELAPAAVPVAVQQPPSLRFQLLQGLLLRPATAASVSYTHLTLPTICSV